MEELWQGLIKAIQLIVSLDAEVFEIAGRSLAISATSCTLATLISLPLGGLIHFSQFPGKRALINVLQTMFSLPTVAVGLFVFVLLSRAGPLGGLGFMFTPIVMVLGQLILVTPLILGLIISEEYGGCGLDSVSYVLAIEEISKACASTAVIMAVQNSLVCSGIEKYGTEDKAVADDQVIITFWRKFDE